MPTRFRILIVVLAGLAAIVLSCAGAGYWLSFNPVSGGGSYASDIAAWPNDLVKDFPKSIPAGATGVRMYMDNNRLMPSPSHFIQIRFIGRPADVEAALAAGRAAKARLPADEYFASQASHLKVIDDGDSATPLPSAFQCFPLVVQPENFSGVAVNPETGEVVYWATIH